MRASVQSSSAGLTVSAGFELASHQLGLGLDVQAGEHEGHLVAEPADAVQRHLSVGGGASPRTPLIRTRSGPSAGQLDGVEPGGDVRVGVAGAGDLVEQLGGDGVDADQPAGAGVLGDHRRAVGVDLGEREAGVGSDRGSR